MSKSTPSQPATTEQEERIDIDVIQEHLTDYRWRINNLYHIRDKKGHKVQFKLNEAQEYLVDNMWYLSLITKARQLGMTTFYTIFYLDQILFSENKVAGIIAHRQEDMKRIFRGKILFALENMHPWMKQYIGEPVVDTANELVFDNGGSIFVSMTTRSQTCNFLHISEYGYICAHDPGKADEILNGAINSVDVGQMISIESTAEGREGHFYRLAMQAEQARKENRKLTPLDFKGFFFPWWWDKKYVLDDAEHVVFTKQDKEYFKLLKDKHGIELSMPQMAWYKKKKDVIGDGMTQEFPSILEEAFQQNLEGAYYSNEMSKIFSEKRIGYFPYDPTAEVHTAWDLGMNDNNVIIMYQNLGAELRVIDEYSNSGFGLEHYVNELRKRPYRWGTHFLPHDAAVRDLSTGVSREQFLWELGLNNTRIIPRSNVQEGIEKTRQVLNRCRFNEEKTKSLTDALSNYRRDFDKNLGTWKNSPRHGPESHYADAMRILAMGYSEPMFATDEAANIQIESFSF